MGRIRAIIFEDKEPDDPSGCAYLFTIIALIALVWMGASRARDWFVGPEVVRKEQLEEIDKEKRELLDKLKNSIDPFGDGKPSQTDQREAIAELSRLEKKRFALEIADDPAILNPKAHPEPMIIDSFTGITLPANVKTIYPVTLRNESGKEEEIPKGSILIIKSINEKGIFDVSMNGKCFAAHESRLTGKAISNN